MSEPRKPPGLTDEEWALILAHATQRRAEEFDRFVGRLGFVRCDDGHYHADLTRFLPETRRGA